MNSRKWILGVISVALLITGFFGYTYGSEVNPGDWHGRGIYIDTLRPYCWPAFAACIVLLVIVGTRTHNDDQDDNGVIAMN